MLFLDDFLEMLDELPAELREKCTEMRHIDMQVEAGLAQNRLALMEFFDRGGQLSEEQRQRRYKELQKEYDRLRILGEMKVSLAERMQEVLETYMQYLDKEKTHFKYELEADNPGITEVIETRFANYCESLIALRKERKRKLMNGSVDIPDESLSKLPRVLSHGNSSSNQVRSEITTFVEDEPISPMVSGAGTVKNKKSITEERRTTPILLKTSLNSPSVQSTNVASPPVSEKSWTPLSNPPALDELIPCSTATPTNTLSSTQLTPTTASTMPAFVGPESRHGRPRKQVLFVLLTTRVQEMFKEAVQRQRHHYHKNNDATHITDFHNDGDCDISEEEDETDDSKRKWCFCNEKSYGDMVACDNKACPYQWFHYPCVNITSTPKGRWYCPHCTEERGKRSESADFSSVSTANII
ncbi:PHD-finger [Dictyocaulus viviparus]|uniref:Inhibitor of growth protein n=1 Tax=Dictyocaulus viviparus TaxID=29172 RepID=A0A0D8XU95_DICVI|nr:PHD-finger [Dictyocaulus viviparus]